MKLPLSKAGGLALLAGAAAALAHPPFGLLPGLLGLATPWYFFAALALGAAMLFLAGDFVRRRDAGSARRLFFASIIYLPLLLGALVAFRR